ncbi:MAG: carboxypeptidase-like regulatory domain-containing protein [Deltaproteobacteria bacterium]|nr:carboxypeptidase-like regulatory domain-containing protein [Deltaproteobacteria bacterium]
MIRCTSLLAASLLAALGCGGSSATVDAVAGDAAPDSRPPDATDGGDPNGVAVSGDAIPFDNGPDGRIAVAFITIVERPELHMTTGADGHFAFTGLTVGSEVTFRLTHPDYVPIQTGTLAVPAGGAERVTFQAVTREIYNGLAALVGITPDPTRCQMVSTVTRIGRSIYDPGAHGEADVIVATAPTVPAESGPIYFNSSVQPQRSLTMTSDDGGVLWTNVAPGRYTLTGTKTGATFRPVVFTCAAGWLVNASPPWGLQRLN